MGETKTEKENQRVLWTFPKLGSVWKKYRCAKRNNLMGFTFGPVGD